MNRYITLVALFLLSACAAKPVNPGAERIFVSQQEPPPECVFVGEVQGTQGNFWTSDFTSDRNLVTGARNEMRNQALGLGANYILIETQSQSHNTADYSLGGTYSSVIIGNAYKCPQHPMAKANR
jgi:hypothetical protein